MVKSVTDDVDISVAVPILVDDMPVESVLVDDIPVESVLDTTDIVVVSIVESVDVPVSVVISVPDDDCIVDDGMLD